MAFQAITTGTSENLKKSLTSLIENPDTSESVKQSAETAKNKLATYESIIQQHKARPNATEVVSLAMRQDMLNDTEVYLDQEIEKQAQPLSEAVEAYNKTLLAVSVPQYSDSVTQNGQVTIGATGDIASVRHINIVANNGVNDY